MKVQHLILISFTVLLSACGGREATDQDDLPSPNFIFFITDDISFNDLGCYGNEYARTPNIDRMAEEGMMFTNAYLTASSCSPSRSSIITGRYPHNTGAPELHTHLPENQVLFPDLMQDGGYYTVLSGKNHMGPVTKRAFDTIDWGGGPGGEQFWIGHLRSRPKDKPFFFWLASYDAHRDWQIDSTAPVFAPDEVWVPPMLYDGPETRQDLASYYHEVSRTDDYLGLLLDELKQQGIVENTYVIYMSDNGRPFPRAKTRVYDSGMKTPFIVWSPGNIEPGVCDALVSAIDLAPTLFDLAGIEPHRRFQGVSFKPLLDDPGSDTREYIFAEHNWHVFRAHERMVRSGDFMYIWNAYPEKRNMCVESAPVFPAGVELWEAWENGLTMRVQEDIFMVPRPDEELYDVVNDPYQFTNLAGDIEFTDELSRMRAVMTRWIKETGDDVPDHPTPDREDEYRTKNPDFARGEMPGAKYGADTITAKGPC